MRITLLGPQRRPRVDSVVRSMGLTGPFATVTAGWQEREADDGELDALLSGQAVNLQLYHRLMDVAERDPEFAAADRHRQEVLAEMAELYLLRLDLALQAVFAVARRAHTSTYRRQLVATETAEAEAVVQDLDTAHLAKVEQVHGEFYQAFPPHERDAIAGHRAEVAALLANSAAFVMAGGHVGVLAGALHLFNVAAALEIPVLAWSAGAMALTERIVLFHDRSDHGVAVAEVYDAGLGLVRGVVALPAAHRRLRMDDTSRMGVFARRFAPAGCLVLEAGDRVDLAADGTLPPTESVLGADGRLGAA